MAYNKTIVDMKRRFVMKSWEEFKAWNETRRELAKDGWAYTCRHGFHDNAEGLCGPCESGDSGYYWDLREEVVAAQSRAEYRYQQFQERFAIAMKMKAQGGMSETLTNEVMDWVTAPIN